MTGALVGKLVARKSAQARVHQWHQVAGGGTVAIAPALQQLRNWSQIDLIGQARPPTLARCRRRGNGTSVAVAASSWNHMCAAANAIAVTRRIACHRHGRQHVGSIHASDEDRLFGRLRPRQDAQTGQGGPACGER